MSASTAPSDRGDLALIRYRLDQIERNLEQASRWRRQVLAGASVALALPVSQSILALVRLVEGA